MRLPRATNADGTTLDVGDNSHPFGGTANEPRLYCKDCGAEIVRMIMQARGRTRTTIVYGPQEIEHRSGCSYGSMGVEKLIRSGLAVDIQKEAMPMSTLKEREVVALEKQARALELLAKKRAT